jgi:hypothetical protein
MPRPLSLKQAKKLRPGQTIYHLSNRNADGTAQRWRVNGKVKTWKRSPERVQVPVKHGMYSYDYITENSLHVVSLTEPKYKKKKVKLKKRR